MYTHTLSHTSSHVPWCVTACSDAEWRLLVKLTDSHWQHGQTAAKTREKHWFYNALNHNNKQAAGHEQRSAQDHHPCFFSRLIWCCVTLMVVQRRLAWLCANCWEAKLECKCNSLVSSTDDLLTRDKLNQVSEIKANLGKCCNVTRVFEWNLNMERVIQSCCAGGPQVVTSIIFITLHQLC